MTDWPLYVGRYIKLSREYSQTPWSIRGQRLTEFSVSESIGEPLKKYFKCDDYKFVTAGREDANVRMLGHGRPFYMQMVNPRIPEVPEDLYVKMEDEINHSSNSESVLVRHLARIQP
jgi:tRNA pseudouridine synthase 10